MEVRRVFISADAWLHISQYLNPRDLCACMRLCKQTLPLWVSDRMWKRQWTELTSLCPELDAVLAMYPGEDTDANGHVNHRMAERITKKRRVKQSFLMPRGGYWFCMQRLAKMGKNMHSLQKTIRSHSELLPLWQAVARVYSGNFNNIIKAELKSSSIAPYDFEGELLHLIDFETKSGSSIRCLIFKESEWMQWQLLTRFEPIEAVVLIRTLDMYFCRDFNQWLDFIRDEGPHRRAYHYELDSWFRGEIR